MGAIPRWGVVGSAHATASLDRDHVDADDAISCFAEESEYQEGDKREYERV